MEKKRKREKALQNGSVALQDSENNSSKDMDLASNRWQNQGIPSAAAAAAAAQDTQAVKVQPPPYWPYSEFPHPPRPYFPVPPASVDRQQNSSQHGHNPPPFPGPWQPPPWFLPYPPFFCPPPPPGNPALHKGVIKTPQGLSQKHQKLWELQSAENMQLWSSLARLETELAAQRSKLAQVEADLQSLKAARQEAATEALPKEAPKRGRYKRTVIGNIPPEAIAPRPRGRKPAGGMGRKPSTLLNSAQSKPQAVDGTAGTNQVNTSKENGAGFGQSGVPSSGYSTINWTAHQTNGSADDDDGDDRW